MEARQRDVGRGVRVVDRVRHAVLDDRLARVELPAEERVDEPADRHDLVAELGREEVVVDLVAVVHRPVGLEAHHHRLGADREAAREDVEVLDRRLQVHQPLARLVVAACSSSRSRDPRDADPLAAVERLHEQRVADPLGDLARGRTAGCSARRSAREASVRRAGSLCGISHVSGTLRPSRIIAQYAECFSIAWNVNGLFRR